MATLALSLAGQVVGGAIGGPIGATIGRALGELAGSAVDQAIFGDKPQPQVGADIRLTGSSEGAPIPRLYGWSRLAGNIIWATELEELTDDAAGAKGFGQPDEGELVIAASFALALCEGEVTRLGRLWADGQPLETEGLNLRFYNGSETQAPDSLLEAKQGVGNAPAYRGLSYIVFERLPLTAFGNRIPNIEAELCRAVGELEPMVKAINVIPGAGEFVYDPEPRVRIVSPGATASENAHQSALVSNWTLSIDELVALYPNLEHVALVFAWFGDDLRCAECAITPRHEGAGRVIDGATWSVAGWTRDTAPAVSTHEGALAYGGTPSDASVTAAIADLKARGLKVTLYPLLMMDIPADNPMGQPAYPWRGRISCDPAPGVGGSPDGTAAAATQVADFVSGYRDFILHYANLADDAGGVDALIIGTEMRGLSFVRGASDSFPFVEALVDLAVDVRAIVGPETTLTYAADWSEATGYQPGGGAKFFHLDPLWASDDIDAVGIDNYMPVADWRDGTNHADAADWESPYDLDYLRANIAGGEGYDWYYASEADRVDGIRAPISDGAYGEHWVWRFKDLAGWWGNAHHNRPGGVRDATPTAWVPESKPIWLTEIGCGAVDKGANQPSAFGDPKSVESTRPFFSTGAADALMQRQYLRAQLEHWADDAANPASGVYAGRMVDASRIYPWAWDARPYPAFPTNSDAWGDGPNYPTGHWLTGRAGIAASDELMRGIAADYGIDLGTVDAVPPAIHGYVVAGTVSCRDALTPVLAACGLSVRDGPDGLDLRRTSSRATLDIGTDDVAVGDGALAARRRPDPSEAVATLAIGFSDRERDYLAGTVTAKTLRSGAAAAENSRLVVDLGGARRAAERLLTDRAAHHDTLEFALPPSRATLEVGDAIALEGQGEGPFEVTEVRDGLARRISARALPPVIEATIVTDAPRAATTASPNARALPVLAAAHLPAEPGTSASRLLLAASASPWPGQVAIHEETAGARIARLEANAALGELVAPLAAGPMALWDRATTLTVRLYSGHLAPADEIAVLAGANQIVVETDAGDWEVIGFAEAELISPGIYTLRQLLRGQIGTGSVLGPASIGNRVVVRDSRTLLAPVPATWLGSEIALRAYAGATDPTGLMFKADLDLDPVLPLAPVHLRAVRDAGSGDVALSWVRCSRADTGNWSVAEVPLDHTPEAYRIDILDGSVVVRTIEVETPMATYPAAEQSADFGAPPASFDFTVRQVSPLYGAGHPTTGHFNG